MFGYAPQERFQELRGTQGTPAVGAQDQSRVAPLLTRSGVCPGTVRVLYAVGFVHEVNCSSFTTDRFVRSKVTQPSGEETTMYLDSFEAGGRWYGSGNFYDCVWTSCQQTFWFPASGSFTRARPAVASYGTPNKCFECEPTYVESIVTMTLPN